MDREEEMALLRKQMQEMQRALSHPEVQQLLHTLDKGKEKQGLESGEIPQDSARKEPQIVEQSQREAQVRPSQKREKQNEDNQRPDSPQFSFMKDLDDIVPEQDMNQEPEREEAKNGEVQSKRKISDKDKSKQRIPLDDKSKSIHKKKHQKKKTFKAGDKDIKFEAYNGRRNNDKALAFTRLWHSSANLKLLLQKATSKDDQSYVMLACISRVELVVGGSRRSWKRKSSLRFVKESLKRLDLKSVDLYQLHWPGLWGNEAYIDGLADAVEQGLVKAVGVSNYKGILSGKYSPENPPSGPRGRIYNKEYLTKATPLLQALAQRYGKTPIQVSLNWLMAQGNVVPIPGAKSAAQAKEFAGALGWTLTSSEVDELSRLASKVAPVTGFPAESF
ncbi:hypothetical protein L7F22_027135 [Adiantum nelumboides]|nr:hypothetical protein [Adiantum nelumboides]